MFQSNPIAARFGSFLFYHLRCSQHLPIPHSYRSPILRGPSNAHRHGGCATGRSEFAYGRLGTTKAIHFFPCWLVSGKKEFLAVVVKAFKSCFFGYFRCLTASPGRAVGS